MVKILSAMSGNPYAMTIAMSRNPVPVFPVGSYPPAVSVVVAFDPDLAARGARAYVGNGNESHENETDTQNQ